jgi:hypothetical protein
VGPNGQTLKVTFWDNPFIITLIFTPFWFVSVFFFFFFFFFFFDVLFCRYPNFPCACLLFSREGVGARDAVLYTDSR